MDSDHFVEFLLTVLPPAAAILVERIEYCSVERLQADAKRVLIEESWESNKVKDHDTIRDFIAFSAAGASEVVGLAPTFISVILSGLALGNSFKEWGWPLAVYGVIFCCVLVMLKVIEGRTYYEIAEKECWRHYTRKEIISLVIYGANGIIIVLAIIMFGQRRYLSG